MPAVPTGMKAGVRTMPRGVAIRLRACCAWSRLFHGEGNVRSLAVMRLSRKASL